MIQNNYGDLSSLIFIFSIEQALVATSFVPLYSGILPAVFRGKVNSPFFSIYLYKESIKIKNKMILNQKATNNWQQCRLAGGMFSSELKGVFLVFSSCLDWNSQGWGVGGTPTLTQLLYGYVGLQQQGCTCIAGRGVYFASVWVCNRVDFPQVPEYSWSSFSAKLHSYHWQSKWGIFLGKP